MLVSLVGGEFSGPPKSEKAQRLNANLIAWVGLSEAEAEEALEKLMREEPLLEEVEKYVNGSRADNPLLKI